jgi:multidrug efflux pump subunit AcrB
MADSKSKTVMQPLKNLRLAGRIAHSFIDSKLTPLVIVAALLLGAFSILKTPREEEPQIVVPMLDVFVQMPGASADEVAQRVSLPMEKLLREVPGVEYIYSISHPGVSMLVVRFYVGAKEEDAIVQTYNKLYSNFDRIPPGVSQPIIKVRSIDDVPIMALTLWGKDYDSYRLRRIAGELENSLKPLSDVSETKIIGGQPRQIRVVLDTQRLAAYGLTPGAIVAQLQNTNSRGQAGSFARDNREFQVEAGTFSRASKTCVRSWSGFTPDVRSTCVTLRRSLRTAPPKQTPTSCLQTPEAAQDRLPARNILQ